MICNIGKFDMILRLIIGFIIMVLGIYTKSLFGIVGMLLVISAMLKFCPLYVLFDKNTGCEEDNAHH